MQMAKSVEDCLDTNSESKDVLVKLQSILLRTELVEELKWGIPYYTLNKKHVVGLAAFKTYTGLWFTNGVFLEDYEKVLINAGDNRFSCVWFSLFTFSRAEKKVLLKALHFIAKTVAPISTPHHILT